MTYRNDLPAMLARVGSIGCGRPAPWLLGVALAFSAGCAGSTHDQMVAFLRASDTAVAAEHYTVFPPDGILIHAPGASEIDGTAQRVRPDGKVSLRLLGDVYVAGMVTEDIAEKLRVQLSRYYVDPEVVVEVVDYQSQMYFVFGEVANPGPKAFSGRDTLLRALADAGPTFLAWRSRIRVVRPAEVGGEPERIVVDLNRMVRSGETDQNILLQPGDIIEVPPTPLAWVGLRVREVLYPLEPAINAYTRPASVVGATRTYQGSDSNNDNRNALFRGLAR